MHQDDLPALNRRSFIRAINLLGAAALPAPWPEKLPTPTGSVPAPTDPAPDAVNTDGAWPRLTYTKNAAWDRTAGPVLFNARCRVDVPISGNLQHLQMIGDGSEKEFIRVFGSTQSYVYYSNRYHSLADSDEVTFEYGLSFVSVMYQNAALPFRVRKEIYVHPTHRTCLQHITLENTRSTTEKVYFIEQTAFALGDPYYARCPFSQTKQPGYGGFVVENRLMDKYIGSVLMKAERVVRVWSRNDRVRAQMAAQKIWTEELNAGKACDDNTTILQAQLTLSPNGRQTLLIGHGAGGNVKEAEAGFYDVAALPANGYLPQKQKLAQGYASFRSPDALFNQAFAVSNKVTSQLYQHPNGLVALPGHMYPRFYSRDSHWHMRGLLCAGRFEEVKQLIEHYTRYQEKDGSFPTSIALDGKPQYHSDGADLDSSAFVALSITEYCRWTNDLTFGRSYWPNILASIAYLKSRDIDNDGWIEQEPNQDWADLTKRNGKVNYSQCVYYHLLTRAAELGRVLKKPEAAGFQQDADKLKAGYDALFWDEQAGFYLDAIDKKGRRIRKLSQDVCLAFAFGLADDPKKISRHLQQLKARCWTPWGPAHHEGYQDDNTFGPVGFYCNGAVWLWITAFEAYAHFRFGKPEDGVSAINQIARYALGKNPHQQVYFDPIEWHDRASGLNCEFDYKTSRNFATGAGAHVWAVVEGLFGLQTTLEGQINWNPRFPTSWAGKTITLNDFRWRGETMTKTFKA